MDILDLRDYQSIANYLRAMKDFYSVTPYGEMRDMVDDLTTLEQKVLRQAEARHVENTVDGETSITILFKSEEEPIALRQAIETWERKYSDFYDFILQNKSLVDKKGMAKIVLDGMRLMDRLHAQLSWRKQHKPYRVLNEED